MWFSKVVCSSDFGEFSQVCTMWSMFRLLVSLFLFCSHSTNKLLDTNYNRDLPAPSLNYDDDDNDDDDEGWKKESGKGLET